MKLTADSNQVMNAALQVFFNTDDFLSVKEKDEMGFTNSTALLNQNSSITNGRIVLTSLEKIEAFISRFNQYKNGEIKGWEGFEKGDDNYHNLSEADKRKKTIEQRVINSIKNASSLVIEGGWIYEGDWDEDDEGKLVGDYLKKIADNLEGNSSLMPNLREVVIDSNLVVDSNMPHLRKIFSYVEQAVIERNKSRSSEMLKEVGDGDKNYGIRLSENIFGNKLNLLEKNFAQLRAINVSMLHTTEEDLKNLLSKSSSIEEVVLYYGEEWRASTGIIFHDGNTDFGGIRLSSLKKVAFQRSPITEAGLKSFLFTCPNVEEIQLYDCSNINDLPDLGDTSLDKLRKIEISTSNMSRQGVQNFLSKCPNLEEVVLQDHSDDSLPSFYDNRDFGKNSLSSLKKVDFNRSSIAGASLKSFLSICPNIEEAGFYGCNIEDDLADLGDIRLDKLRKIKIASSSLTRKGLSNLLSKCPNLEEIFLDVSEDYSINDGRGYDFDRRDDLGNIRLDKLRKITVTNSSIIGKGSNSLFSKCPNVEYIDLHHCTTVPDLGDLFDIGLSKLRNINLSGLSITEKGLKNLLSKCPNLEGIDLSNCKISYGERKIHDVTYLRRYLDVPTVSSSSNQTSSSSQIDHHHEVNLGTRNTEIMADELDEISDIDDDLLDIFFECNPDLSADDQKASCSTSPVSASQLQPTRKKQKS